MQDYADGKYNNINDDVMKKGSSKINNTVGYATSVVIILLYACMVVVTGIDLSFIGVPRLRPILYSGYGQQQQHTNRGINNTNNNNSKPTCLITNELRVLVDAQVPHNVLLKEYIKKRAFILILVVIVTVLFIQSTIFLKMGMNVGGALLKMIENFIGA